MKRIGNRFLVLLAALLGIPSLVCGVARAAGPARPNIVVILADDLGYGDLGCYGHPSIRTPNLDRMAGEGVRFTQFYAAANVCTPSRAALLTGRLPIRSGMAGRGGVLFPGSLGGLPASEVTLPEALKSRGYATGMVGKWHLGDRPEYLPTRHGFDSYFGIPYSNDMDRVAAKWPKDGWQAYRKPNSEYWNLPLLRDEQVVERAPDQAQLTGRYTEEAVAFIRQHKEGPFFLYLAHNFPHVPLFASERFRGRSLRGLYGDVVEELDWSVGQVLDALRREGLAENTLVFFTSDNGPWLTYREQAGSAGLLRDGKGSTWEGGMREPGIAWWPGTIKPAVNYELASTMDIFSTALALAGAQVPRDRVVDGVDLTGTLLHGRPTPRTNFFFYRNLELYAARKGAYKLHLVTHNGYDKKNPPVTHSPPLLFDLNVDPGESFDVAREHPDVVADLLAEMEKHKATVTNVESQIDRSPPL